MIKIPSFFCGWWRNRGNVVDEEWENVQQVLTKLKRKYKWAMDLHPPHTHNFYLIPKYTVITLISWYYPLTPTSVTLHHPWSSSGQVQKPSNQQLKKIQIPSWNYHHFDHYLHDLSFFQILLLHLGGIHVGDVMYKWTKCGVVGGNGVSFQPTWVRFSNCAYPAHIFHPPKLIHSVVLTSTFILSH